MQTLLYKEYDDNLKPTYKIVGEETVIVPAKINIDDVAFSVAFMSFEYVPTKEDEEIYQGYIIASEPAFLAKDDLRKYSMSGIIERAMEIIADLTDEQKKQIAGFLVYCEQGLCFYEPLNIN